MLDIQHDHHAFRFVDPVQDAPLGTEARAMEARQLAPERLTDPVRRIQQRAGDELDSRGGHVLGKHLGDRTPG